VAKRTPNSKVKRKPKRKKNATPKIPQNSARKAAMIAALEAEYGIVSSACKLVGIDRNTHYNWYEEDEKYKLAVDELKNVVLDFGKSQLRKLCEGYTVNEAKVFITKDGEIVKEVVEKEIPIDGASVRYLLDKNGYGVETNNNQKEKMQPPDFTFIVEDMSDGNEETPPETT